MSDSKTITSNDRISMEQAAELDKQTQKAYDWIADGYTEEWQDRADLVIIDRFLKLVPAGGRILDLGCGPGHYSKIFIERGFSTISADYSAGMLMQAKKICKKGVFLKMDIKNPAFAPESFDAIWICAAFSHIPEVYALPTLVGIRNMMRRRGSLFINAKISSQLVRIESPDEMKGYHKAGRFFQRYKSSEIFEGLLAHANIRIIDTSRKTQKTGRNKKISPKTEYTIAEWVNYYCKID